VILNSYWSITNYLSKINFPKRMVTFENELGDKIPETETYFRFGIKHVYSVNEKYLKWLAQQSFADDAFPSEFEEMVLSGEEGRVQWQMDFAKKVENKELGDKLLHVTLLQKERQPNISHFGSKPNVFDTANYIYFNVSKGGKDWVKTGMFTNNLHIEEDYDAIPTHERVRGKKAPLIPIHTFTKEDALNGFNAALEWQKYRSMATTCADFLEAKLKKEHKEAWENYDKAGDPEGNVQYDLGQRLRYQKERANELFLHLLPNTLHEDTPSALKTFYRPGALEATLALELGRGVYTDHVINKELDIHPIHMIRGSPIEITETEEGYDAVMKFSLSTRGHNYGNGEDEETRKLLETALSKQYNVSLTATDQMHFTFELKDAHLIDQAIREGKTDTELHQMSRGLVDTLIKTDASLKEWYKTRVPEIEQDHQQSFANQRAAYFLSFGGSLSKTN
jgi:hypothetical protein